MLTLKAQVEAGELNAVEVIEELENLRRSTIKNAESVFNEDFSKIKVLLSEFLFRDEEAEEVTLRQLLIVSYFAR